MQTSDGRLQWHPAFGATLHIEFEQELDILNIREEYLIGKKPMQIDMLIIKKEKDIPIQKNIGRISGSRDLLFNRRFFSYTVTDYKRIIEKRKLLAAKS